MLQLPPSLANAAGPGRVPRRAPLLVADPALGDGLADAARAAAQRDVLVTLTDLPAGRWTPTDERPRGGLGLLVVAGLALRGVELAGRRQAQIVGPGDLLDPWSAVTDDLTPHRTPWRILDTTTVAVVDEAAFAAAQRHPGVALALLRRSIERSEQLAALAALIQLPRIDLRLLAMMWHLAQRWGRMTADGAVLHLPLTHEGLGHLIGARRPSVTLALQQLDAAGLVHRRGTRGEWLVVREAGEILHGDGAALDAAYAARTAPHEARADVASGLC